MRAIIPWSIFLLIGLFCLVFVRSVENIEYGSAFHKFQSGDLSGTVSFSPSSIEGSIYHSSSEQIDPTKLLVSVHDEYDHPIPGKIEISKPVLMPNYPGKSYTRFVFRPEKPDSRGMWINDELYFYSLSYLPNHKDMEVTASYFKRYHQYKIVSPIFLGWKD